MSKKLLKSTIVLFIIFIGTSTQSCKVYSNDATPELEAVASAKKVKVRTIDGISYKFNKLVIEEDNLVGLTKPKSNAAKYLPSETFVDEKGKTMEKVSLDRETIKAINEYDEKKSKKRTVWLAVGIALGIVAIAAAGGFVLYSAA